MRFYDAGPQSAISRHGIAAAIEAILASPQFLFRVESRRRGACEPRRRRKPRGGLDRSRRVALASRLSFFLWAAAPDAELTTLAMQGRLTAPGMLEKQVRACSRDPRADSLSTRFAAQWLRLNDVDPMLPDAVAVSLLRPHARRRLHSRDRAVLPEPGRARIAAVLDLLTADYSLRQRADRAALRHPERQRPRVPARHAAGVPPRRARTGQHPGADLGRRPHLAGDARQMDHGSAARLAAAAAAAERPGARSDQQHRRRQVLSTRERMEEHRKNPACQSCHKVIDPLGLALDNFDVTGKWRIKDNGVAIDAAGVMYDGTKIDGPASLRDALLKHQDVFLQMFTENLMTYALGRRVEYYDMPAVRAIVAQATAEGPTASPPSSSASSTAPRSSERASSRRGQTRRPTSNIRSREMLS